MGMWESALSQGSPTSERKSTTTAIKYSAYGTAIPVMIGGALLLGAHCEDSSDPATAALIGISLGALGAVVGPGLGHTYVGRWGHLAKGSLFRGVGAALIAAGLIPGLSGMGGWGESDEENGGDKGDGGAAVLIGSAIHDFRTLDDAVERYNQKHADVTLSVAPAYFSSEKALGVVVSVGF